MLRVAVVLFFLVLAPITCADAQGKPPTLLLTMENGGQVTIELWPDVAPNHVKNFVDLTKEGFYDGQRVHRVEPKFVVQFGDPASKTKPMDDPAMGTGGSG